MIRFQCERCGGLYDEINSVDIDGKTLFLCDWCKRIEEDAMRDLEDAKRTAHWEPTFIDGKQVATCSVCGAVEWDYDTDDPWEYCHGCGAKVVEE